MIFYTVGTQLPFDRLTMKLDDIAQNLGLQIVGQIGKSKYKPQNFSYFENLAPAEYDDLFNRSKLVISHAGMGTILRCLSDDKPIIVCPRLKKYSEHRNDHQLDTVSKLSNYENLNIIYEVDNLEESISEAYKKELVNATATSKHAPNDLIVRLREIIQK